MLKCACLFKNILTYAVICCNMLTYTCVYPNMLTYAAIYCNTLWYAVICWHTHVYNQICWHKLQYAVICFNMLTYVLLLKMVTCLKLQDNDIIYQNPLHIMILFQIWCDEIETQFDFQPSQYVSWFIHFALWLCKDETWQRTWRCL